MVRKIAPTCALCAVMSLLTACGAASDTPTAPSSTMVTPSAPMTGVVQGIVKHETIVVPHLVVPEGPLSGAQVLVTEGVGAGQTVTTGADGAYRFELPPGPFRVRWSAQGYEPRESEPGTVIAGSTTPVNTVMLRLLSNLPIAEWSISGIVRDGLGNPVADVWVYAGDALTTVAETSTDAAGRFRIASTRQHVATLYVNASKGGYLSQFTTVTCGPSCAITVDFRLLRLVRQWLDGPSTLQVGDLAAVTNVLEYDDGSRKAYATLVTSSNPAVLQVLPLQPPYDKLYVRAIAPGTATLQLPLASQTLILNVRVVP